MMDAQSLFSRGWKWLLRHRALAPTLLFGGLALTGCLNVVVGWGLVILAVVLVITPWVERAWGMRLSFDPNPSVPKKRKQVFVMDEPISNLLMGCCLIIGIYAVVVLGPHRINISVAYAPTNEEASQANLITVRDKSFHDTTVTLDGHRYIDCWFTRVLFTFNGGYYEINNCKVDLNHVGVDSQNQPIQRTMQLFQTLHLTKDVTGGPFFPGEKLPIPDWSKDTRNRP